MREGSIQIPFIFTIHWTC